jgi:hypothetical protein
LSNVILIPLCPSARLVGRRPVINSFLWPIARNVLGLLGDVLTQSTSHAGLTLTVSDTALYEHRPTTRTQKTDSDGVEGRLVKKVIVSR